jgi:hypothetical protein
MNSCIDRLDLLRDYLDCIDPDGMKRQVLFIVGDYLIWLFVFPNGIFRFCSSDGNAVVRAIALLGTIGVTRGPNEQRHIRITARQVIDGWISLLLQPKNSRRFGDYPSGSRYTGLALSR